MAWTEMASSVETDTDDAGTIRTVTTKTYAKASGRGYLVRVDKTVKFEYNSDGIAGLEVFYGMPGTSLCYCVDPDPSNGTLTFPGQISWSNTETDTALTGDRQVVRGKTYTGQPQTSGPSPSNLPGLIHRQDRSMEDDNGIPLVGSIALAWEQPN